MIARDHRHELRRCLESLLARPRSLKPQSLRHIEDRITPGEESLECFLSRAASELEDYEVEIIFAPVFTPTFAEQRAPTELLTRYCPTRRDVDAVIEELAGVLRTCDVVLPDRAVAPLELHIVLIERFVRLLHLDAAPPPEDVEPLFDLLGRENALVAATLLRGRGFTPQHQDWLLRFLRFVGARRSVHENELLTLAQFIGQQRSLEPAELHAGLAALERATVETGNFAQKGRMYWSSDVAEHHHFRGQGDVDRAKVEHEARELRIIHALQEDLRAFDDILGATAVEN